MSAIHDPWSVDEADAFRIRALVHRLRHEQDDATKFVESSVGIAARLEHPWTLAEVQREAGEVYLASGRREQAVTSFRVSASAFDRVGATRRSREMLERVAGLTAT